MKVIKRDGRVVEYNREKIKIAIEKANNEVKGNDKASSEEIKEIIKYIEDLDKKRILVEDIQDIIEEKLMAMEKFKLAKKYMIYRYTRALVRKQNTTDESILGIIKNQNKEENEENINKNLGLACTQRDYIAGEVSKDLTKRILLPEKIAKAHEEGILHFHNMEYFLQLIIDKCIINIKDMLDNGTVINGIKIGTPKTFYEACILVTQIILNVASNQYGKEYIDICYLGKYVRKSYDKIKNELKEELGNCVSKEKVENLTIKRLKKEISLGINTIFYQLNTIITATGRLSCTSLILNLNKEKEYIKENEMIIKEILKQKIDGLRNEKDEYTSKLLPNLIYVLDEENSFKEGEYDYLTRLALECSTKCGSPSYISAKKMCENNKIKFNQGLITINLPQIAIITEDDEEKFWKLLEERLEICKEALLCRHYSLLGTQNNTSPIHWQYGAISRINKGEKIDELLKRLFIIIIIICWNL